MIMASTTASARRARETRETAAYLAECAAEGREYAWMVDRALPAVQLGALAMATALYLRNTRHAALDEHVTGPGASAYLQAVRAAWAGRVSE